MGQNSVVVYSQAIQAHLQAIVSPVPVFAAFNRNFSSTPKFVTWMLRDVHQPVYPGPQSNKGIDRPTFQISVFTQQTSDGFTISQQVLNSLHGYTGILGKRNLFSWSECPAGLLDLLGYAGPVAGSAFIGLTGTTGIAINGDSSGVLKAFATTAGVTYTLSVFVRMVDGGAPVCKLSYSPNADLCLTPNATETPATHTVQAISSGLYRVSVSFVSNGDGRAGVAKLPGQSARNFSVSGFQIETGSVLGEYIPSTDGPGGLQVSKADVQWLYHSYNDDEKMAQVFLDCTLDIPT